MNGLEHARKMYIVEKAILELLLYEEKDDPMIKYKQLCGELEAEEAAKQAFAASGLNEALFALGRNDSGGSDASMSGGGSYLNHNSNDDDNSQFSLESHHLRHLRNQQNKAKNEGNGDDDDPAAKHHQNMYSNYNSNLYSIISSEKINVYNNEVLAVACGAHLHWHLCHVNDRYRRERAEGDPVGIGGGAEGAGIPPEYHQFYRLLEMGLPHKVP